MKPDNKNHDTRPEYIHALVYGTGKTRAAVAAEVGVVPRTLANYMSRSASAQPIPYPVQFLLEKMAGPHVVKRAKKAADAISA